GGVLTLKTARKDDPLASINPPKSAKQAPLSDEPSHLETVLAQSLANLPLSDEKGARIEEPPTFATGKEAIAYARKRAHDYYKKL
ncbi:MAG TPA: hypothetical protein VE821_14855, partial [Pyrinomonadaceae bacterium]|nr:hypothetical protein [Pyrinomonadaceae bacterium]